MTRNNSDTNINNLSIVRTLKLPYKGNHDIDLLKSVKTSTKKTLHEKHVVRIILKGTKLSS